MGFGGKTTSLTAEQVDDAENILESLDGTRYKRLQPVFSVADYFIRKMSKRMRAEPDQIGVFDKRHVEKLKGKVFGKGQSESAKTLAKSESDGTSGP